MPPFKADRCLESEPGAAAGPSNSCRPTKRQKKHKKPSGKKARNKQPFPGPPFEGARRRFSDEEARRIPGNGDARNAAGPERKRKRKAERDAAGYRQTHHHENDQHSTNHQGAPALTGGPVRENGNGGANGTTPRNPNHPQMRPWNQSWHPNPDGRPSRQPANHSGQQPPNRNGNRNRSPRHTMNSNGRAHTNPHSQRPIADGAKQKKPTADACFTTRPIHEGYVFVEKGSVYITRTAKKLTEEAGRTVYIVRRSTETTLGIQVPREFHEKAIEHEQLTREDREYTRSQKLAREKSEASRCLEGMFGKMPKEDRRAIVDRAFVVNSGRVGRSGKIGLPERLRRAAIASLRHNHTDYEQLLVQQKMEIEREPGLTRHGKKYIGRMSRARDQARAAVSRKIEEMWKSWEPPTANPWASMGHKPKEEYLSKGKAPSRRRSRKAASDEEDEEDAEGEDDDDDDDDDEDGIGDWPEHRPLSDDGQDERGDLAEVEPYMFKRRLERDSDEELRPRQYNTRSKNRQQPTEVFSRASALEELVRKRKDREEVRKTAKRVKGQVKVKAVESESSDDELCAPPPAREGTREGMISPNRGGQNEAITAVERNRDLILILIDGDEEEGSKVDIPNIVRTQDEFRALVMMNAPEKEREVIYISD